MVLAGPYLWLGDNQQRNNYAPEMEGCTGFQLYLAPFILVKEMIFLSKYTLIFINACNYLVFIKLFVKDFVILFVTI